MNSKTLIELKSALYTLGVKSGSKCIISFIAYDVAFLEINGEYFGAWHIYKKTFVD